MEKLLAVLRKHVVCITLFAFFAVVAIFVYWVGGKGSEIVSYLSLASAIVAIVLAAIVIVYMYYQDNRAQHYMEKVGENVIQMRGLISDVPRLMKDTAQTVEKATGSVREEVESLRNSFLMRETTQTPTQAGDEEQAAGTPQLPLNTAKCLWLPLLVFYTVVKAYQSKQSIRTDKVAEAVFEARREDSPLMILAGQHSVLGIILGLSCFLQPKSIEVTGKTEVKVYEVSIKKLPPAFVEHIPTAVQQHIEDPNMTKEQRERLQAFKDKIDQYFARL